MNNKYRVVLNVREVQQLTGLSRGLIYEAIRQGTIPSVRIGRRIIIPRERFEAWLAGPEAAR